MEVMKNKGRAARVLRTVNFIDAQVAILTLQNTLIMVNRTTTDENAILPVSVP